MKVLFAVHDEKVSLSIVKKYQREYKEIISYKNVYYFNAILKELQRDKSYDRVVIDEELEEFTSTSYEEKDKFIFNKLDNITDEASNSKGSDIPIILICSDRRTKSEDILVKLFGIGIYNAIIGNDRSTDEVCRLIYTPRSKKEAKNYYKIDAKDVEYDPEHENDVSEEEMQHILSYFNRLGKNESKFVEGFRKIVSQYNEEQLKVIVAILPLKVKSILEEKSPEYQKIVGTLGRAKKKQISSYQTQSPTSERLLNANDKGSGKPVVVPSSLDKNLIKKVSIKKPSVIKEPIIEEFDDFEEDDDIDIPVTPKRRGRPSKKSIEERDLVDISEEPKKKKRGRPPKKVVQEVDEDEFSDVLPGFDEEPEVNNFESKLPGVYDNDDFDDNFEEENNKFSGLFDEEDDLSDKKDYGSNTSLPGLYDDEDEPEEDNNILEENDDIEDFQPLSRFENKADSWESTSRNEIRSYEQNYDSYDYTNYNNLLSSNRKVIAFVGTSKNGTSFIVNNIAKLLADNGIDTAILDATQNKNSYYIYNKNDDRLRTQFANSIEHLVNGVPAETQVYKNLSIYVEVPGQSDTDMQNVGPILENLIKNHSAVLIDCDFNTPLQYFANAQEIYLVQSMDVLTIQPLTAFLKELKNKDILDQSKLRIIVNKAMRLKGISPKQIVGGMSNYNNPEMSIMTELFDRNSIVPIEIPFDETVYAKYLEGLADCDISINKYPREFQEVLKKLSSIIYPLLPSRNIKDKHKKGYQFSSGYTNEYSNGFSNSVNNTLNNMKRKY